MGSQRSGLLAPISVCFVIAACGGDDSQPAVAVDPLSSHNTAPTITGTPPSTVLPGNAYFFEPTASDADGDPLTFSISGKPAWASFTAATGRLEGTPSEGDIGPYGDILITANDGQADSVLPAFGITVSATSNGAATLTWLPPTENTDGTPLTDLAGFKIYWGTVPGLYTSSLTVDNPGITTYVVENLVPATYYFVATALNGEGGESELSNEATSTVLL
jgi:hypothetical protein